MNCRLLECFFSPQSCERQSHTLGRLLLISRLPEADLLKFVRFKLDKPSLKLELLPLLLLVSMTDRDGEGEGAGLNVRLD